MRFPGQFAVVLLASTVLRGADVVPVGFDAALCTNALQLRCLASATANVSCSFDLEGSLLWAGVNPGEFILQDSSGAVRIESELPLGFGSGDRIRVRGRAIAGRARLRQVLLDNDGRHSPTEVSESIYLPAGRYPLTVDYFNALAGFELNLEYQGPNIPRQKIPSTRLFRAARPGTADGSFEPGLEYRCYEGTWETLPDFSRLTPVKTGSVGDFDLGVRSRDQFMGLQFSGYVEVDCAGVYTFWLRSDDGSRLSLGGSTLAVSKLSPGAMPAPRHIAAGQRLGAAEDGCWAQAEGTLLALDSAPGGGMEAVLGYGTNRLRIDVMNGTGIAPPLFSTIRATGIVSSARGQNEQPVAARLLAPDLRHLETLESAGETNIKAVTLAQVQTVAATHCNPGAIRLDGVVLAVDPAAGSLVFADGSSVAQLHLPVADFNFHPGQRLSISGDCTVEGAQLEFRPAPLVDNDGVHTLAEKSAAIFLSAGKHPLHLCWFNCDSVEALDIYWQAAGQHREKIPAAALLHAEPAADGAAIRWAPGLEYQAYEGRWPQVPNPLRLEPLKQGRTTDFDTSLTTRARDTALEFSGYLDVPREGVYTFTTASDDGCLLFVDTVPMRVRLLGEGAIPAPATIAPHQILDAAHHYRWAEVAGRVTFASPRQGGLLLELSAGTGRMVVEVADASGASSLLLLNSRIRATGICQTDYTPDGQLVAGSLLVPSVQQLEYEELAPGHWAEYPEVPIGRLGENSLREDWETVAHVRGKIVAQAEDGSLVLEDGSGQICLQTRQAPPVHDSLEVEAIGRLCRDGSNSLLRCAFYREPPGSADEPATPLPLLTSIEQVKRLSRRDAQRSYPVNVRGVVTTALTAGCFIQDGAWAIYVRWPNTIKGDFPRVGEYWEIEGITFAEFAPNIRARRAVKLGTGVMPEPLRPSWDQLINGSLDTRYVEIQGVVTEVEGDGLVLLTRDGRIKVQLLELKPETLKLYDQAVVRLRGCLVPEKDVNAHKVELGRIGLSNSSITVDEPAPADPFALPLKRVGELLLFDPRASSIQRVKLSGQVLQERHGEYFLVGNGAGLRCFLRAPADFRPRDLVEVVGFPDLSGPSPVLREALARRVGRAALPLPVVLSPTNLLSHQFDATLVRVQARLANLSFNRTEQVLELQSGGRGFVARLDSRRGRLERLDSGTELELSGVYAGQGGDVVSGRDIDSFELLLNSPADVRVLRRPSWWTGRHALMLLGGMSLTILAALAWITQLRRQVEERSQLLASEVRRHEQTARQHALEHERARISRDLHDDLGATLTQIRLLSVLESRDTQVPPPTRSRLAQVTEKARQMVASLDEIVWAVNPANDFLPSLATYLCQFAEEFLRPTAIRCRLDVAESLPALALTSEVRHNLYLAVREALNNIAKHSQAKEVWLRIHVEDHALMIALEDDGQGFSFPAEAFGGDGLGNMRARLEHIGGRFECQTQKGAGTTCRISLPLNGAPSPSPG